jgi:uncharacterized membrane protein YqiK
MVNLLRIDSSATVWILPEARTEFVQIVAMLVVVIVVVVRLNAKRGRQTILDYQRGIRFEGGKFQEILGPGCHRFHPTKEQITLVDLRNQPIIVERFFYPDSAGENACVSISAGIQIADVHRAIIECNDHVNEAVVLIRNVLRGRLSAKRAVEARCNRRDCEQEIKTHMAGELERIGLALTSLEITEVSSPVTNSAGGSVGVH